MLMNFVELNRCNQQQGSSLGFEQPQNSIVLVMYIRSAAVPEAEPVDQMHFQTAIFSFIDLMALISTMAVFPEKEA